MVSLGLRLIAQQMVDNCTHYMKNQADRSTSMNTNKKAGTSGNVFIY
jgi:hypothetical protein